MNKSICAVLAAGVLAGCVSNQNGSTSLTTGLATLACGVGGGFVGSLLGGGKGRAIATGAGVVIGALACNKLASYLEEGDLSPWGDAAERAAESGNASSWNSPETGNSGTITPSGSSTKTETREIKVLKNRVEVMPPLDAVGDYYETTSSVNVRGGPGTDYRPVRSALPVGQKVFVVGQVKGSPWFAIDDDAAASEKIAGGFVHSDFLKRTTTNVIASKEPVARESTVKEQVVSRDCEEMTQEFVGSDGNVKRDVFLMCRSADGGWTVE